MGIEIGIERPQKTAPTESFPAASKGKDKSCYNSSVPMTLAPPLVVKGLNHARIRS
jgi:hypothetical protein